MITLFLGWGVTLNKHRAWLTIPGLTCLNYGEKYAAKSGIEICVCWLMFLDSTTEKKYKTRHQYLSTVNLTDIEMQ